MKKGNVVLIIICILLVSIGIIIMPSIYKVISTKNLDSEIKNVTKKDDKKVTKKSISLKSEVLNELVYPIMHNDKYGVDNYYKFDKISVTSLSNNDILYNAFLQIYSGYLVEKANQITFSSNYLESRIKNIFGPKTGYNLTDFKVPTGSFSNYVGTFKYNQKTHSYVYQKDNVENKSTVYYDIKEIYNVNSPDDNTINTFFYVAFIKVVNGKYTLYSDYNYTDEVSSGTFTSNDDIKKILSKLNVKKYQYTFRKDTCNYDSYCFYEGKWVNG